MKIQFRLKQILIPGQVSRDRYAYAACSLYFSLVGRCLEPGSASMRVSAVLRHLQVRGEQAPHYPAKKKAATEMACGSVPPSLRAYSL